MKYLRYVIVFIMLLCINTAGVKALSCTNKISKDLGELASYVKVDYEVIDNSKTMELKVDEESTTYFIPNFSFEINIYNITENLYVTIEDDVLKERTTVYNKDTVNNNYKFTNYDFGTIYNYKIYVHSAVEGCYGETIRTIRLTKPKYNAYSEYKYCQNSSNLYCQKFTSTNINIENSEDFISKIKPNSDANKPVEEPTEEPQTVKGLLLSNWKLYTSIFLGVITIITIIIIIFTKSKKKDKGWEL